MSTHRSLCAHTQALPRRGLQLLVVLLVLLPLCRLPSLKPLAPASLVGALGTAATALCIVVRLLDGSYAPEGAYFEDVRWTPAFSAGAADIATRLPSSYGLAFFLSLLSQAFGLGLGPTLTPTLSLALALFLTLTLALALALAPTPTLTLALTLTLPSEQASLRGP